MFFLWHGEHACAVAAECDGQILPPSGGGEFLQTSKTKCHRDSWDSMKPLCKGAMPARGAIYEKEVFRICHGPLLTLIFPSGPDTLALATVFKVPWPLAERALA